jgi:Fe-S-cluster containining protein
MSDFPTDHDQLVARQAERWNDPHTQERAGEMLARASVQARANEPRTRSELRQLEKAPRISQKIYWLRQLADTFATAVGPHAACRDACSACCYQPVSVTLEEAELIARETGVSLHTPAKWSTEADMAHVGQPCPFLRDARCSIYSHRPMACRLMFNMDADALLCQMVPGQLSHVPYADYNDYKQLYVRVHLGKVKSDEDIQAALRTLKMADLREFFPPQERLLMQSPGPTPRD